jgi:hypothetical protein
MLCGAFLCVAFVLIPTRLPPCAVAAGLCPLPEASNDGINAWLQTNNGGSRGQ